MIDGEQTLAVRRAQPARRADAVVADRGLGRPRAAARALSPTRSSPTRRGTSGVRCRTSSAELVDVAEAQALLERDGHPALRLVDNGAISGGRRVYHLIPARGVEGRGRDGPHAGARVPAGGVHRGRGLARGPRRARRGRALLPRGQRAGARIPRAERTEAGYGDGFYEAVDPVPGGADSPARNDRHKVG